jgi:CheY-like chemotaxis protein
LPIKCPKCSTTVSAEPDELGLVTCSGCGARLRSKGQVKLTIQGGASTGTSGSSPSLPRIDPAVAAPADVDSVLARIDAGPSPDATIRPGAPLKASAGGPTGPIAAPWEQVLNELRAVRQSQEEILRLLRERPVSGPAPGGESGSFAEEDEPAPAPSARGGSRPTVLLIDDDAKARQEAVLALQPIAAVKTAVDGNGGIAAIAMEKPKVIVLELGLGGSMPGRDVVNMIKATMEWVDIPIVLHTRMALGEDADARQIHGADEIVAKGPGSSRVLAQKVAAFLGRG